MCTQKICIQEKKKKKIHLTVVISTSIISNNRLSERENLVLVLTQKF